MSDQPQESDERAQRSTFAERFRANRSVAWSLISAVYALVLSGFLLYDYSANFLLGSFEQKLFGVLGWISIVLALVPSIMLINRLAPEPSQDEKAFLEKLFPGSSK